jgi:membrane protein implicated in regulation of membrane protease activity
VAKVSLFTITFSILGETQMSDVKTEATKAGMMRVEIKRDYWPANGGERIKAGEVVDLPEKEAKHLVNLEAAKFPKE